LFVTFFIFMTIRAYVVKPPQDSAANSATAAAASEVAPAKTSEK
jgi:hypothetical protein